MAAAKQRYKLPILYYENNLIFTVGKKSFFNVSGKECWACYRVVGGTYDFLNTTEKILMLQKDSQALKQIYSEGQLIQVPTSIKINDNINYLRGMATGEMKEVGIDYLDDAEYILNANYQDTQGQEMNDYEVFFLAKLKKPRTLKDFRDVVLSFFKEPYRTINEALALDITEIYKNEIKAFQALEHSLRKALRSSINITPVNEIQIEKLIKEPFWRGLQMPKSRSKDAYYDDVARTLKAGKPWKPAYEKLEIDGEIVYRPLKRDILTLCSGEVRNKTSHIEIFHEVNGEQKISYQKQIVIANIPDIDFPTNREWIYRLRELPFPVWASIRMVKVEYTEVLGEINKKRKDLDDQLDHNREAGAKTKQEHMEQDQAIDDAQYDVQSEKKPFIYATIIITVAADDLQTCTDRAKSVQDFYDGLDIETHITTADQFNLFYETLIGSKQYAIDYLQRIPPETLAGCMITANNAIGNQYGFYIGTTGIISKPVFFNPFYAPQVHKSPAVSFTGTLGRGKSALANLIALLAAYIGAKILIIDPKGDRGNWGIELPEIRPYLNVINLSPAKSEKGKLDIFTVLLKSIGGADAPEEKREEVVKTAAEFATSILGTVAGYKTTDERMEYLADAINAVAKNERVPCMLKIIWKLEELEEEAKQAEKEKAEEIYGRLARTFRNIINNTRYGHLLFGDGTEDVIDITKPINLVNTQNLTIPPKNKPEEDFNFQERVGMGTLICLSAIGMQFATQGREILKIYLQDEASVFKRSSEGRAMFNRLVKMGRTENAPIFLLGQNISDIGEDEDTLANIGTMFCFGTSSLDEAKNILRYLGLNENSVELQKMLVNPEQFGTGICFMRDIDGRIAIIDVDLLLEKFRRAFDTKPQLVNDAAKLEAEAKKAIEEASATDEKIMLSGNNENADNSGGVA